MSPKNWVAVFAALFVCLTGAAGAPLEAYGRLPSLSNMTLSPDGSELAYARSTDTKLFVVIHMLGVKGPYAVLNIGGQKLRALQWADKDHLLITTSVTGTPRGVSGRRGENFMAQYYDLPSRSLHALLDHVDSLKGASGALNIVLGVPQPRIVDGRPVVFVRGVYFPANVGRVGLFRVDLRSNSTSLASRERSNNTEDWVIDGDGNIVAEEIYNESEQHWKLVLHHDGEHSTAVDVSAPIEGPEVEGLSEDGSAVIVRQPPSEEGTAYLQYALKDGTVTPWQHGDLRFGDLQTDVRTGRVVAGSRLTDKHDHVFFEPHSEAVWKGIKAAFSDAIDVELVSRTSDFGKAIVRVFGVRYGDGYFIVDMTTHKADPIGSAYEGIEDIAPVKWIEYRAADGRPIHAYLTTPLNREAKNLPLIVLPHGGPHARDWPGFDWISQALASRGYVVLQPQFRGSDGFGRDLLTAGFGEFGKKMQTDLSDGVRALAAQGLVDPKRVCIVGASYGGYAALAGATLDLGVYRCAVSIAGLSDVAMQLSHWHWRRGADNRGERFWDRFLAVEDSDDPKLDAISPIKHVDKVTIPILLIHGKDDTVVPFAQSDDMADALKHARKPYEFVVLPGEDHWLSKSETRLQMLQATVKFLEANNPPN